MGLWVIASALVLTACSQNSGSTKIKNVTPKEFNDALLKDTAKIFLDVRTPEEYANEHIAGAINYNINDDNFDSKISKLDTTYPVYVYCLAGGRSSRAAEMLAEKGFKNIYNLSGGIGKWVGEGLKTEKGKSDVGSGMNKTQFEALVNKGDTVVFVDFNAPWCAPCKKILGMLPNIEKATTGKAFSVVKIDYDKNKSLLTELGGDGIPFLLIYKNGKQVWKHSGSIEEAALIKEIQKQQ